MDISVFKAVLHTAGKIKESILEQAKKDNWIEDITDTDIENIIKYYDLFDGSMVNVAESFDSSGYTLLGWEKESEEKVKEAIYIMEQDEVFGIYKDDREGFEKIWDSGDYYPDASITFAKDDVEIIERV